MRTTPILVLLALLLTGCSHDHPQDEAEQETPAIAFTRWTGKTELFMEYPPLAAGEKSRFAIHLTELGSFKPLTEGRVTVELVRSGAVVQHFTTDSPSRPGIFGVDVQPREAGDYTLVVRLQAKAASDEHSIEGVKVHSDAKAASAAAAEESSGEEEISFLKEQQWKLDFSTEVVRAAAVRDSLRVAAEVQPRAGGDAEVTAPVAGRLQLDSPLAVGTAVSRGQVLARLLPHTSTPADFASVTSAHAEATAAYELARRDRERAERLLAARAVPARRVEEARAVEAAAEARLKSSTARRIQDQASRTSAGGSVEGAFQLRAPVSGVIAEAAAVPGGSVEAGEKIFRIVAIDAVHVVANVPESELPRLRKVAGAELEVAGSETPLPLTRRISIGRVVDPVARTVPVIYLANNTRGELAIGQAGFLRLFTGEKTEAPTVSEGAVVDDGGRPVVFVQLAGESFARRPVTLGDREGGRVQLLEGVKAGERVVTKGAYLIRLAALSPQIPAHGHVH